MPLGRNKSPVSAPPSFCSSVLPALLTGPKGGDDHSFEMRAAVRILYSPCAPSSHRPPYTRPSPINLPQKNAPNCDNTATPLPMDQTTSSQDHWHRFGEGAALLTSSQHNHGNERGQLAGVGQGQ
mmetsp:Transcript_72194/g.121168  ORF Transcript_72194/g.121168 Transcript_72194/m.121168 type:complete len:125 (-) Transcript_72194:167-541(-)